MAQALVFTLALLAGAGAGATESKSLRSTAALSLVAPERETPGAIHERYDKMDEFLKIMFTIGCKWKHQKDVHNYAAQGLKDQTMSMEEFEATLADTQEKEAVALKRACGMINAVQMKKCRESCAARWNAKIADRDACDEKCVSTYTKFEELCLAKAGELKGIYAMTAKIVAAKQKCYTEWCPDVPTVYTMTDEKKMETEVETRCGDYCMEDKLKMRCKKKFQLEVDFVMGGVKSGCAEKGTAGACLDKKKGEVNSAQEKCKREADSTCNDAKKACEGKADGQAREAAAFCDKRWKMCDEQATAKCLKQHDDGLAKLKGDCEKKGKADFDKCVDEDLKKKEEDTQKECEGDKGKSCPAECKDKCKVTKMTGCLANLKQPDATKNFCEDFWRLIEEKSEIDPKTGDPMVESITYTDTPIAR